MNLSDRVRQGVEAEPWVVDAIKHLEQELAQARAACQPCPDNLGAAKRMASLVGRSAARGAAFGAAFVVCAFLLAELLIWWVKWKIG